MVLIRSEWAGQRRLVLTVISADAVRVLEIKGSAMAGNRRHPIRLCFHSNQSFTCYVLDAKLRFLTVTLYYLFGVFKKIPSTHAGTDPC